MSKRHVAFIKPDEPSFLKKLKQQAGYKEGPTLDTKREREEIADEDLQDTAEEQPTVVVLKPGDLTAEEAFQEEERLKKELEEAPADLSAPIVFNPSKKKKAATENSKETSAGEKQEPPRKKSKKPGNKCLLSFDDEENDD